MHDLHHRYDAVGGAACGGYASSLGVLELVDPVNDGRHVSVLGGGREHDALAAGFNVFLHFKTGPEHASAFKNQIHLQLRPGQVTEILDGNFQHRISSSCCAGWIGGLSELKRAYRGRGLVVNSYQFDGQPSRSLTIVNVVIPDVMYALSSD